MIRDTAQSETHTHVKTGQQRACYRLTEPQVVFPGNDDITKQYL